MPFVQALEPMRVGGPTSALDDASTEKGARGARSRFEFVRAQVADLGRAAARRR